MPAREKTGSAVRVCTAERVAKELAIRPEEVLVASTGVIGAPLNTDAMSEAVPRLS